MGKEMLYKLRKVCYNKLQYYPNGKAGAAKAEVWQIFVKPVHQSGVLPFADGSGVAPARAAISKGSVACMVFWNAWALAACGLSQDARISLPARGASAPGPRTVNQNPIPQKRERFSVKKQTKHDDLKGETLWV